jgi:hypothetical protein
MQAEVFLADTVHAADGKLHALGIGWRVLTVQGFPARHDRIGLGIVVHLRSDDGPAHTMAVRLRDPDGRDRALGRDAEGHELRALQLPFEARGGGERTATFALNLDGLVFDRAGGHTLAIEVDGHAMAEVGFQVRRAGDGNEPTDHATGVYL